MYTAELPLTVHSAPCPALEQARHRYDGLRDEGKANGPLVLFLVLDALAVSFEEQFLTLDARLDEIQVELLTNASRGSQAEVLAIRRRLADAVHSLGWYTGDLDDVTAAGIAQLPCLGPGAQAPPGPAPPACSGAGSPTWASRRSCQPAGRPDNCQQDLKQRLPAIQHRRHDSAAAVQPHPPGARERAMLHDARHGHKPHHLLRRLQRPRCWRKAELMTR